ncbi:hypothetical protein JHK82_030211 [Glycine max]|uniref:Uncharacterized protein n=1 Tax=Glycine max TaxID=3847 RepID=C6SVT1_SOYBN|nr:unknown [Glycine max]KAG4973281.1 hypothetical protein JHK87_030102 [Glycine soja]KAG4993477.1 hypothetical protein JHK86_030304 [Glycine max]KAG5123474.1 hypothetical protein JHK82_030211 [Glycine max]KAG5144897.1 hypothetical protein JHK84_030440 [Glycine max]
MPRFKRHKIKFKITNNRHKIKQRQKNKKRKKEWNPLRQMPRFVVSIVKNGLSDSSSFSSSQRKPHLTSPSSVKTTIVKSKTSDKKI